MKPPLISFTNFVFAMDYEVEDTGGENAPSAVFDSQIRDYRKMITYVDKLVSSNRDAQLGADAEEFYFLESSDVVQNFGDVHAGISTVKLRLATIDPTTRTVTTNGITTEPGPIASYLTPEDYFTADTLKLPKGVSFMELYANKLAGEGDLKVYIDVYEVQVNGVNVIANITSDDINLEKKKNNATVIGTEQDLYKVCLLYTSPSPRD